MSSRNTLIVLAEQLALSLQPLDAVMGSPEALRDFLEELGWKFDAAPSPLDSLRAPVQEAFGLVNGSDGTEELDGARLLSSVRAACQSIMLLGSDAGLPTDFRDEFPRQLVDYLVVEHLLNNQPRIGCLLMLLGIVSLEERPAAATRAPFLHRAFAWESLSPLLRDPPSFLKTVYRWDTSEFDGDRLIEGVAGALEAWGVRVRGALLDARTVQNLNSGALQPNRTTDSALHLILLEHSMNPELLNAGAGLFLLPETAAAKPGFALLPFATAGFNEEIDVFERLALSIRGDLDLTGGAGVLVRPNRDPEAVIGLASGAPSSVSGRLAFQLRLTNSGAPLTLIGSPDESRFDVAGVSTTAGARVLPGGKPDVFVEFALEQSTIVVKPDGGVVDGFLASLLPPDGLRVATNLGVGFSTARGLYFTGSGGLEISVPAHIQAGPIEIESALVAVRPKDSAIPIDLAATIRTDLTILKAAVQNVGLTANFAFPANRDGNLGPLQLDLDFRAPDGVALSVDTQGVVTGGGFLRFDPAKGLYAGVMQLSLHDSITLTAYGLIATKMPDGSRGFSILIFITADGFKPIPLGFGFVLQSIGGMLGINRTFDQDVLKAGLKTDTLGTLLFPRDPVGNAPAILQALASAFPARRGSYLLGLLARITWFTPTLVQMDLALILELGARTRLLMLGRVSALLPSRDNDLIRLNLDAVGVLDFDAGTLAADAVLVDSRLVHRFPITGSAALRARWPGSTGGETTASGTDFILAVGGVNPRFAPPAGFPILERVTIALCTGTNPRLVCDAYFAVTANTVQFGARASLYAEAIGFSVSGDVTFDALVTLLPPHFLVDFHAAVQLKRGSHNLFKVTLNGTLEGPLPLRLAAKAKFEILWFSFTLQFDFTLAAGNGSVAGVAAVSLANEVAKALADPMNWTTRRPPAVAHGVVLRPVSPGPTTVPDPLGQLVLRQQVAPLNTSRDVNTFGGAPVTGRRRFQVAATLNAQAGASLAGEFAPARYFVMSDDEKLAAPSFETMDAGFVLGAEKTSYPAGAIVSAPLDYRPITLGPTPAASVAGIASTSSFAANGAGGPPEQPYSLPSEALKRLSPSGAAARVPVRRVGRARYRNAAAEPAATIAAPRWQIVRVSDGVVVALDPGVRTWSEHREVLDTLNRGGARWLMVPAHELESLTNRS
jgi:Family of unknown function (DUF6603)